MLSLDQVLVLLITGPFIFLGGYFLISFFKFSYDPSGNKKWGIRNFRSIISIVVLVLFALFIVNTFFPELSFNTPEEKIAYGEEKHISQLIVKGYDELRNKSPENIDFHYRYINAYLGQYNNAISDISSLEQYYTNLASKSSLSDIGHYCLGLTYSWKKNSNISLINFDLVKNRELKYLNNSIGYVYLSINKLDSAEKYYRKEIDLNGNVEGAYSNLIYLLRKMNRHQELVELAKNKNTEQYFDNNLLREIHYKEGNIFGYIYSVFKRVYDYNTLIGFIAALLVSGVWLMYIKRIDIYEIDSWVYVLLMLFLGALFSFGTSYLSDINHLTWGYRMTGNTLNDFLYCVLGIGAIEELVKIIPLFMLLALTKEVNEPYDYILYASASALGFAFVENIIYFNSASTNMIHGRALTAVVGHMTDSSLVAYGLMLAKYKKKQYPFLTFALFFGLASIFHGFWDFILFKNISTILFLAFYILCIRVWATNINNTLNNSDFFNPQTKLRTDDLRFYLVVSLTGILIFEYMVNGWIYGPRVANNSLLYSSLSGSILILFLTFKLSQFDLRKNFWHMVNLSFNPFASTASTMHDEDLIGSPISIYASKYNKFLIDFIPNGVTGKIIDRKIVALYKNWYFITFEESRWFLIELDRELNFKDHLNKHLLLRFKDKNTILSLDKNILAEVLLLSNQDLSKTTYIKTKDVEPVGLAVINPTLATQGI